MQTTGQLVCRRHELPFDRFYITYTWEGGDIIEIGGYAMRDAVTQFPHRVPSPGDIFWIGPYRMRVLTSNFLSMGVIACRERPVKAQAIYALYRATRGLDWVYRRLIITLYVWGLACYDDGQAPTWRDIKGTKWIAQRLDARQARRRQRLAEQLNEKGW